MISQSIQIICNATLKKKRLDNLTCNFINLQFFYAQKGTQVSLSATEPVCLKTNKYQQLSYSLLHCMPETDTSNRLIQALYLKQDVSQANQGKNKIYRSCSNE